MNIRNKTIKITWLSPFLYSNEQSINNIRGFSMHLTNIKMKSIRELINNEALSRNCIRKEILISRHSTIIANKPSHLGMCDILVDHYTIENTAVFETTSGYLLDFRVTFDVDFAAIAVLESYASRGIQGDLASQIRPFFDGFRADARSDNLQHLGTVFDVDFHADVILKDYQEVVEGAMVTGNNHSGVHLLFEEWHRYRHQLTGQNYDRGGAVTDLFILRTRNLHHRLGGRVFHHDLRILLGNSLNTYAKYYYVKYIIIMLNILYVY